MLKIAKYNTITGEKIDLKQLEKYGFTYYNGWLYKDYTPTEYQTYLDYVEVRIWKNREIYFMYCYDDEKDTYFFRKQEYKYGLDLLYDLIKDGLVEKVEE